MITTFGEAHTICCQSCGFTDPKDREYAQTALRSAMHHIEPRTFEARPSDGWLDRKAIAKAQSGRA